MSEAKDLLWLNDSRTFGLESFQTLAAHRRLKAARELPALVRNDPELRAEFPRIDTRYGSLPAVLRTIDTRSRLIVRGQLDMRQYLVLGRGIRQARHLGYSGVAGAVRWRNAEDFPRAIDWTKPSLELIAWISPDARPSEYQSIFGKLLTADTDIKPAETQVYAVATAESAKEFALSSLGFVFAARERLYLGAGNANEGRILSERNIWLQTPSGLERTMSAGGHAS